MKKIAGGSAVAGGFYLNIQRWELVPVPKGGGSLPGGSKDEYLRIATPAALLLTPILGGLFVVFLPVIGFVLTAHAVLRRGKAEGVIIGAEAEPS